VREAKRRNRNKKIVIVKTRIINPVGALNVELALLSRTRRQKKGEKVPRHLIGAPAFPLPSPPGPRYRKIRVSPLLAVKLANLVRPLPRDFFPLDSFLALRNCRALIERRATSGGAAHARVLFHSWEERIPVFSCGMSFFWELEGRFAESVDLGSFDDCSLIKGWFGFACLVGSRGGWERTHFRTVVLKLVMHRLPNIIHGYFHNSSFDSNSRFQICFLLSHHSDGLSLNFSKSYLELFIIITIRNYLFLGINNHIQPLTISLTQCFFIYIRQKIQGKTSAKHFLFLQIYDSRKKIREISSVNETTLTPALYHTFT
jgi:hypothetical protein